MKAESSERFARALVDAETRLRATGLGGRRAFAALVRHLAGRLGLPAESWPEGPDAPAAARLEELPLTAELDLFGLAYERFFPDLFKGALGQYFTPRPLVELMVELAGVRPGDRVLDPSCGSGGFLVAARARGAEVEGIEVDPDLAALARLNLAIHGAPVRAVRTADFFAERADPEHDVVLANPPFSVPVTDPEVLARYRLAAGRRRVVSDVLFLEAALRTLRPGGRLVTVLPYGVLTNRVAARLRAWVEAHAVREAVVSLPEGLFTPFGGTQARACVVALRRAPSVARRCLAAVIREPGYEVGVRTYRRREPDELVGLRLALRAERGDGSPSGFAPVDDRRSASRDDGAPVDPGAPTAGTGAGGGSSRPALRWLDQAAWVPEEAVGSSAPPATPRVRVAELAELAPPLPAVPPGSPVTLLDFVDADRQTGEVTGRRVGRAGSGSGRPIEEGDVLFGRMRPELGNATIAGRSRPELPVALQGSTEWIALRAYRDPEFLLLALRSGAARDQLGATSGQTRPRVAARDVLGLEVPDPGPEARRAVERVMRRAKAERRRWRLRMEQVEADYESFGRGEIDADELVRRLGAGRPPAGRR